ncbi:MAG: hypothetical protein COV38_15190 [Bdellovibrionales bacterium CG11_big_fil_rev_8_21_14_0_20_38_13]|nr:MAG: hypothetical protein COV38_15190 [Bdellovibrionales bacterium CG11_big_fil_rev_8_21_14_0_20_38_13]
MKTLILIFVLLISASSFANCSSALTNQYTQDSVAFQLSEDEVDYEIPRATVEFAKQAVTSLQQKLGCKLEKIGEQFTNANCQEVVPGISSSNVCYVEGRSGYFLVSVDMLENINIVFNRFD